MVLGFIFPRWYCQMSLCVYGCSAPCIIIAHKHQWTQSVYYVWNVFSIKTSSHSYSRGDFWSFVPHVFEKLKSFPCVLLNPLEDHWLGLNKVFSLTKNKSRKWVMRVDLWDHEGGTAFAQYKNFWLGNEKSAFKLHVGKFRGSAGNASPAFNFIDTQAHWHKDWLIDFIQ